MLIFTDFPDVYKRQAINQAGSVKGKQSAKHAVSDWMDIEKQRGISVTSSVLQFNYAEMCIRDRVYSTSMWSVPRRFRLSSTSSRMLFSDRSR